MIETKMVLCLHYTDVYLSKGLERVIFNRFISKMYSNEKFNINIVDVELRRR